MISEMHGTAGSRGPLLAQLCWFIRLRWMVGATVLTACLIDWRWLRWYEHDGRMLAVGAAILFYNAGFWAVVRGLNGRARNRVFLRIVAGAQILLDLACLTAMTVWTGSVNSPLLGFYVFHMVFASLLLPRFMAYGGATVAILMLIGGLWLVGRWPPTTEHLPVLGGWVVTLLMTVHLSNRITRGLRHQRRRLIRQNRHIRLMSDRLRQQQQAMIQQEKMVALGQMAAGITHEIANPLASMDSLLQLIQRKPERATPQAMATLREQIERISQIVRQMTTFGHPDEGQWETLPLNDVVEQTLQMVRFDHRLRQVHVERQFSPTAGLLRLIPQAIQQIVVNLVLNALDALNEVALPRLTIRTERDGQWCLIEVSDNGPGIPPENVDRLFEPFFTTKPVGKGTGLGLSISYSLARKQGGDIEVRSQPGQGATFTVRLPVTSQSVPVFTSTSRTEDRE